MMAIAVYGCKDAAVTVMLQEFPQKNAAKKNPFHRCNVSRNIGYLQVFCSQPLDL